ncbi:MAG: LysM peptidoglycan-binding domain-containing protein [Chloroflexi bacterium]|nr:LysM peptidoglycan-binding domain-containing protein [Chloroflexota bacterium]
MNGARTTRQQNRRFVRQLAGCSLALLLAACSGSLPAVTPTSAPDSQATTQADAAVAATSTTYVLTAISRPIPTAYATATATTPLTATIGAASTASVTDALTPTVAAEPTVAPLSPYTVQAGDTLLSIAMSYHVSMASIMLKNDLFDTGLVKLGQVLQVPTARAWPDENVFWTVYVVEPGETLLQIAQQHDVALADVVRINDITDAGAIQVGQKLVMPSTDLSALADRSATLQHAAAPIAATAAQDDSVPAAAVAPTVPPPPPAAAQNIGGADAMRSQLLALYNQARASYGVGALVDTAALQLSAQLHAQDCAQRGYGSHMGSDGATTAQRISRAGFTGRITGENWAWARSAAQAFDMWYYQEAGGGPHRSNILSPRYTSVGFGVAASNGGYYFIADFGAP